MIKKAIYIILPIIFLLCFLTMAVTAETIDPPEIVSVEFNADNTMVTITSKGIGVEGIYVNMAYYPEKVVVYNIPKNTKYIKIQVKDTQGNMTPTLTKRVPGWTQITDTIQINPVKFSNSNETATITATSEAPETIITGIYVEGTLYKGNPVVYEVPKAAKYLELQAVNSEGDKSEVWEVRIPGWTDILENIYISSVEFSDDATLLKVTAIETGGRGVAGIYVGGEFHKGDSIIYNIPDGTKHLKLQAENNDGDLSPIITKRVPGWSQVVDTLKITGVEFTGGNKIATVSCDDRSGQIVSGVYVNEEYLEGNPVVYEIPENTKSIKLQAINETGDLSAIVNRNIPELPKEEDESSSSSTLPDENKKKKSTLSISIQEPEWTNEKKAKVKVTAKDRDDIEIEEVLAATDEDSEYWDDITDQMYLYIKENTTVRVSVTNAEGKEKEVSKDIECFDFDPPEISATQSGDMANIRITDKKSGVSKVVVGNSSYSGKDAQSIQYNIPTDSANLQIQAEDVAGNTKNYTYKLAATKTASSKVSNESSSSAAAESTKVVPIPIQMESEPEELPGLPLEPEVMSSAPTASEPPVKEEEPEEEEEPKEVEEPEPEVKKIGGASLWITIILCVSAIAFLVSIRGV